MNNPVNVTLPGKIIGICGHPLHGKSTAQRILQNVGVEHRDDSRPLRLLAMQEFNLTWEQVSTQAGKLEMIFAFNTVMTVRQAIGDLGKIYEKEHGPNYWIERAIAEIDTSSPVSFGSVRMGQAHAIRAAGGLVLAIHDPRRPLSTHDFDQFDPAGVDHWVTNNSHLWQLEHRVVGAAAEYLGVDFPACLRRRQEEEMIASMVSA